MVGNAGSKPIDPSIGHTDVSGHNDNINFQTKSIDNPMTDVFKKGTSDLKTRIGSKTNYVSDYDNLSKDLATIKALQKNLQNKFDNGDYSAITGAKITPKGVIFKRLNLFGDSAQINAGIPNVIGYRKDDSFVFNDPALNSLYENLQYFFNDDFPPNSEHEDIPPDIPIRHVGRMPEEDQEEITTLFTNYFAVCMQLQQIEQQLQALMDNKQKTDDKTKDIGTATIAKAKTKQPQIREEKRKADATSTQTLSRDEQLIKKDQAKRLAEDIENTRQKKELEKSAEKREEELKELREKDYERKLDNKRNNA